jgi:hypothetical protein
VLLLLLLLPVLLPTRLLTTRLLLTKLLLTRLLLTRLLLVLLQCCCDNYQCCCSAAATTTSAAASAAAAASPAAAAAALQLLLLAAAVVVCRRSWQCCLPSRTMALPAAGVAPLSSTAWSVGLVAAYLGLYTAYDKGSRALRLGALLDVVLVRKGAEHSLVQGNKVLALSGLTALGMALWPGAERVVSSPRSLLLESSGVLAVHGAYSLYKYYGTGNIPALSAWRSLDVSSSKGKLDVARKVSFVSGMVAKDMLIAMCVGWCAMDGVRGVCLLSLGVLHFYTMEIDYKAVLQVRPFAYLAFAVPLCAGAALLAPRRGA